jgi:hypothetical protein
MAGNTEAQRVFKATAMRRIANALGLEEIDVAIDWSDYLTPDELAAIKVGGAAEN